MSAYRANYSCETTFKTCSVKTGNLHALDNKSTVGVLSINCHSSKAFDSLLPPLMTSKLKAYNFSDKALKLVIRSYFENRQGRVTLKDAFSSWRVIEKGCPQGSCFGPLLWNIFQNDMYFSVSGCQLSMYADDHHMSMLRK